MKMNRRERRAASRRFDKIVARIRAGTATDAERQEAEEIGAKIAADNAVRGAVNLSKIRAAGGVTNEVLETARRGLEDCDTILAGQDVPELRRARERLAAQLEACER